jgi:transposase
MPRPIPVPMRKAMFRLWQKGYGTRQIAESLRLPCSTVRRLLQRFRRHGIDGIPPDYWHASVPEAAPSDVVETALSLRREHPTWGAGLIRVQLSLEAPERPIPSERTLQRWFVRADLSPAPAGRPPRTHLDRATAPHETWQMDAKEHIRIKTRAEVSWLRLIDECSSAVLWTAVFPPRGLAEGPPRGGAGTAPPGLDSLGVARPLPSRQRLALGLVGRFPYRPVAVADRSGYRDALEQPAAPPRERGRRAFPRDVRPVVRAVDVPNACGIAGSPGANGPPVPRALPVPETSQSPPVLPGPGAFRPALRPGLGDGAVGVVARGRTPDDHRAGAARRSNWSGFALQQRPLCREAPSRKGCLRAVRPRI